MLVIFFARKQVEVFLYHTSWVKYSSDNLKLKSGASKSAYFAFFSAKWVNFETPYFNFKLSDDYFTCTLSAGRWNDGLEDGIDNGMDTAAGWKPAVMVATHWKPSNWNASRGNGRIR
ncbi:hypothetical protein DdX_20344 [Ditylenchus destructor]|uniref:Uncharacterized protein n=1 Tax=Ditylenchus destructor TaxID=166010 RepID=A0AAD4MHC4_9BILA|nr:hypothetical protein DdX_20344 [Ditylenchus destructor]